jgi:hypothetical protein
MPFVLSVANKPIMLSVVMLSVVMLSVILLNAVAPFQTPNYTRGKFYKRLLA